MRKWSVGFAVALVAAVVVLLSRSTNAYLLLDTDTKVLLVAIRARHAPFSWFFTDWPLQNHFYRPLSTLTFELDNRLYGDNALGYAWTNAILAALCVLALFWFLRELTDRPLFASIGTVLFAYWQAPEALPLSQWLVYAAWAVLVVGVLRHRGRWRSYLPAFFVLWFLATEISGIVFLGGKVVGWLPGRTASTMTVFALAAMAAYARYERLRGRVDVDEAVTPLTPPATRSSRQVGIGDGLSAGTNIRRVQVVGVLWAVAAVVLTAGALACYEQAVMVPACLLAVAITFRCRGCRPSWAWQVPFWALVAGYYMIRLRVIPPGVSGYQRQQFRTSVGGPLLMLGDFVFPPYKSWPDLVNSIETAYPAMLLGGFYSVICYWISGLVTVWELRREWVFAVSGWGMAALAFLPMALFKQFEHYYYWPMALRSLLLVSMMVVAWKLSLIALSPPSRQAPARLVPAPGSLPHP